MPRKSTQTWPDLAAGMFDKLTGRNAQITYQFEHLEVYVPQSTSEQGYTSSANWEINGAVKIRTKAA